MPRTRQTKVKGRSGRLPALPPLPPQLFQLRWPNGDVIAATSRLGYESLETRPVGAFEQWMSVDGGKTWRWTMLLQGDGERCRIVFCQRQVARGHGMLVRCEHPYGHEGPCE